MDRSNGTEDNSFEGLAREAGETLRKAFRHALENPRTTIWADFGTSTRSPVAQTGAAPEVIDAEPGVWAIVRAEDGARVERVFASELDALRALQGNTDPTRSVQFLEFGAQIGSGIPAE